MSETKVAEKPKMTRKQYLDAIFKIGKKKLNLLKSKPNTDVLKESAECFIKAIKLDTRHSPSYFYLSYIFYALDNTAFSVKYFKLGEAISVKIPKELESFKKLILNEGAKYKEFDFGKKSISFSFDGRKTSTVRKPEDVKAKVSKDSSLWKLVSDSEKIITQPAYTNNETNSKVEPNERITTRAANQQIKPPTNISAVSSLKRPEPLRVKLSEKSSFWNIMKK